MSSARSIQSRACGTVKPSLMNVQRGISGSRHASAMGAASERASGRNVIAPSESGNRSSGIRGPVAGAGALSAERGNRRARRGVERTLHHHFDHSADAGEAVADGLTHEVTSMDAFEDDRQLVRGERLVELELAHVAAR